MMYVGNYKSWIDPTIIQTILQTPGERRPKPQIGGYESLTESEWNAAGFDMKKIGWEFYYNQHINREHIDLPINPNGSKYKWWFTLTILLQKKMYNVSGWRAKIINLVIFLSAVITY